jgi:cyclopropane-fatty-acyl-phospholipid synthase
MVSEEVCMNPNENGLSIPVSFEGEGVKVYGVERWMLQRVLHLLGDPPIRVVLWNGEEVSTTGAKPVARVIIKDRKALFGILTNPELHFGDAYSEGRIDVEGDLVEFLEEVFRGMYMEADLGFAHRQLSKLLNRPRQNSLTGSKENIHHHYDIGNDFYRLWLDERMLYTCAYFPDPSVTLEEAQLAKMDHVCRKLQLRPGETVVEAGCGWGGLAIHMARHYGVKAKAYNISHQQIIYARERAEAEGLRDRVEFIEDDYRNISGRFDAFVSVGMLEHVGPNNYRDMGNVIGRCLKENGRGLVHSIGRNKASLMNAWIERRIFPGAYPPTLREMMEIFEPGGFSIIDVENLRMHYARTLEHWLERFEKAGDLVSEMFDQRFVRAWRLYLAGSKASFTTGYLQLFQVVFAHPHKNDVPWTRKHLYEGG